MRPTPEAVVKAFEVVDGKAGAFLVMERATRLELMPRLGQPRGPRDDARQRNPRAQFIQPLGRE